MVALPDNRAGFEPFRACGIADALPNFTGTVAGLTGVSFYHSAMPPPTERLKTGAGEFKRLAKPWARRVLRPTDQGDSPFRPFAVSSNRSTSQIENTNPILRSFRERCKFAYLCKQFIESYLGSRFRRGTPNAYEMDEGRNYENHPFLSNHGIST